MAQAVCCVAHLLLLPYQTKEIKDIEIFFDTKRHVRNKRIGAYCVPVKIERQFIGASFFMLFCNKHDIGVVKGFLILFY